MILTLTACGHASTQTQDVTKTTNVQTSATTAITTTSSTTVPTQTPAQTTNPTFTTTATQTPTSTTPSTPTPTITSTTVIPSTQPVTASITPFNFSSALFDKSSSLDAIVQSIDQTSGNIVVNGGDLGPLNIPFTFDWGDGIVTSSWFPGNHIYSDKTKNYVIKVTANYRDGTTGSTQLIARFLAPVITPVPLPDDIAVTIPSSMVSLASRMPGYQPSSKLTVFNDSCFTTYPRATVEYVLTAAASIQKDLINNNVYLVNGGFNQVVLSDPTFNGMYSLWYTSPVSFGAGNYAFQGTPQWSSFFHEMGHNFTLNSPANYYYGGKLDGNGGAIFGEALAQMVQHATAISLINDYKKYGLSEDLAVEIKGSALSSMRLVRRSYEAYLAGGKQFASWNDPSTTEDETFNTFMTVAYVYFEHAETSSLGYQASMKRMMTLFQLFDANWAASFDSTHNTQAAAAFRSTLMVTALSYAFKQDLRPEFKDLNFPIDDQVYDELYQKASSVSP